METRGLESAVSGPAFAVEKKTEPCKLHGQRSSAPTGGTQCGMYVRCVQCTHLLYRTDRSRSFGSCDVTRD
jgi:hypothetical protein